MVIARASGDLSRSSISAALRSCYPDFVAKKKAIALVEETLPVEDAAGEDELTAEFQDVQELLDDHHLVGVSMGRTFPKPMWLKCWHRRGRKSGQN